MESGGNEPEIFDVFSCCACAGVATNFTDMFNFFLTSFILDHYLQLSVVLNYIERHTKRKFN